VEAARARTLWHGLEAVNAVTYFAPECRAASEALGLRGFWMGYFACRAAPMGPVGPAVVEATFFNFHPARVRRAIPEAWTRTTPAALVETRAAAAAAALGRSLPDRAADALATAVQPLLDAAVEHADPAGRPLFAANRDLPRPVDPVAALWQAATTLREHRGDAHVALLVAAGIDGCEAHVLASACTGTDPELLRQSRGWSTDDWGAAVARLASRGLVAPDGAATSAGRDLRAGVERRTDELAAAPYAVLGDDRVEQLIARLGAAAVTVASTGDLVFPNPMGLPPPAG
jgi:hypothetical protein